MQHDSVPWCLQTSKSLKFPAVEIKDLKEKLMETVKAIDYLPNEGFNPPPVKAPVLPCPECPICFEEMKPPVRIVQCKSGHLVCQQCKDMPQVFGTFIVLRTKL